MGLVSSEQGSIRVVLRDKDGGWVGSARIPDRGSLPEVIAYEDRLFVRDEDLWESYILKGNCYREATGKIRRVYTIREEEPC